MLPPAAPRKRGDIETERALAEAKLVDAETIEDAVELAAQPRSAWSCSTTAPCSTCW